MSNDDEWRWADPAGQQRLVRTDELRAALASGVIPSNAPVWQRGWEGWQSAHDVPELQTSALSAANGVLANVPPPPLFVVAAQSEFEGSPKAKPPVAEPPAPPRYVPNARPKLPSAPPPVVMTAKPAPVAPAPVAPAPVPPKIEPVMVVAKPVPAKVEPRRSNPPPLPKKPDPKPGPRKSIPPPLPAKAASQRPPPMPASPVAEPRSIPTVFGIPALPNPAISSPSPDSTDENWALPEQDEPKPASRPPARPTLPIFPAPPPMTELPPSEVKAAAPPRHEESPAPRPAAENKYPTLIQFGGAPESDSAPSPSDSAPIVVPPPEPSQITGAVTRPPPWGEGAVGMSAIPKQGQAPQIARENVEELSGSLIIPDDSRTSVRPMELSSSDLASEANMVAVKPAPLAAAERRGGTMQTLMGMPPPGQMLVAKKEEPAPVVAPPPPAEVPSVPPMRAPLAPPSGARSFDLRELARTRPPTFLIAGGAFGALILLGLVGVVVKIANGCSSSTADQPVATASQTATATAPTATTPPTASVVAPPPVASAGPVTCSLVGEAKTLAPHAQVGSGIEVRAVSGTVALGFATGPKEGVVQFVDPTSFASSGSASVHASDTIRRVVALKGKAGTVDSDRKGDALQGRRTVVGEPLIDLGSDGTGLVWAPHGTNTGISLWSLAGTGNVEALRAERGTKGNAYVAFRQGASVYFGAFGGSPPAPVGALAKVDGLGPQVGSPAIAAGDEHAFVVWSDRATAQDPWGLRYVVFGAGKPPTPTKTFVLPPGGLGEQAMSPGVTALPGDQFLLLWTEGPTSSHQVRALVFGSNGEPHGSPLTVSADGVNAGQGQAALLDGGHGLVAFLGASGKNFEVVATPISCVSK